MTALVGVVEILSDILDLLTTDESEGGCPLEPYCRVAVYPGLEVAWDTCEESACSEGDGQLWAAIQSIDPLSGNTGTGCDAWNWTAQIGSIRCAAKPSDNLTMPSVEAIQDDAVRQAIDADGILKGIKCCPERSERIKAAAIVIRNWLPLGPDGGCVGGVWTISGRFDVCC